MKRLAAICAITAAIAILLVAAANGGKNTPAPVSLLGPYTLTAGAADAAWQPADNYGGTATWNSGFVTKAGDQLLQVRADVRAPFTDGLGDSASFSLLLGTGDLLGTSWSLYDPSPVDGPVRSMFVFQHDSLLTAGGPVLIHIGPGELAAAPITGDIDLYFLVAQRQVP